MYNNRKGIERTDSNYTQGLYNDTHRIIQKECRTFGTVQKDTPNGRLRLFKIAHEMAYGYASNFIDLISDEVKDWQRGV